MQLKTQQGTQKSPLAGVTNQSPSVTSSNALSAALPMAHAATLEARNAPAVMAAPVRLPGPRSSKRRSAGQFPLGPLGLKHAARLFARQCPLLHTANDRRKFTSALLTHADAPDVLGAGLPGAIVASAFSASRADLERILSRATASPPPGGASSSSPFTPIRGGGLSSGFSTPGGE